MSYPDGTKENIVGIKNVAIKFKVGSDTIFRYLSKNIPFKGYTFKKVDTAQ